MESGFASQFGLGHSWGDPFHAPPRKKEEGARVLSLPLKRRKYSALIVEDDMTSIYLLDVALNQTGQFAKLDWATSAEEAMGYITKRQQQGKNMPYDLVIIDIFLDGRRTGVELWQYLQANSLPEMPVIMTSGISEQRFQQLMSRYAKQPTFLKKPFAMDQCVETITNALRVPTLQ